MPKRAKIYTSPDPVTEWQNKYRTGVEKGAETYARKKDEMAANYTQWISYVLPNILDLALKLPSIPKTDDPAENYRRRGAPFAYMFKRLSRGYREVKAKAAKERITATIATILGAPTPAPTPERVPAAVPPV